MTNFHGDEAKKKIFFFEKKNSKWPTQKKLSFSTSSKAEQFPPKFHGFILGLVGLNDAKGTDFAQPIWPWGYLTYDPKQAKNAFFVFFACFGAYVGQPDGHIGWVTLMPFASINPTNPRTNLWNFGENCSAFGDGWKTQFFWVGHFEFFFSKKKFFFCFFLIQISQDLWCTKDFSKFWWLPWFPAKI